jgi:hypothetical protein
MPDEPLLMPLDEVPLVPTLELGELDVPDMPVVADELLRAIPRSQRSLLHAASASTAPPIIRAVAKPVTVFFMDLPPKSLGIPRGSPPKATSPPGRTHGSKGCRDDSARFENIR